MDTNLIELFEKYNSEERCREYLELLRWPTGVCCVRCGDTAVWKLEKRNQYECHGCGYQFSATAGTVFHDSHLPLWKWFLATYLICEAKKGLSANQMKRTLGVSYKTAWYLCHRIREAMKCDESQKLTGTIEVDETFIGGQRDLRRKRMSHEKPCVVGVIQRGGDVRAQKVAARSRMLIGAFVKESVEPGSKLMTDQFPGYRVIGKAYDHSTVKHYKKEYVRGNTHTNSIENFWSLFKRGLVGSFHKVSEKHLDRYLDEFTYRFNGRKDEHLFTATLKNLVNAKAMPFEKLTKTA
ncbi:MAG: IS1595 family transposase [Acidobacteria bacterium]|nr:IS1595 family transposase [Acidobacteriota bacterium]